jgi:hypothetical protein
MTLRDRIRRWWSPAQWEDDHPAERKQRSRPEKGVLNRWFSSRSLEESEAFERGALGSKDFVERDFKKPR